MKDSFHLRSIRSKAEELVVELEKSNSSLLESLTISIISISDFKLSHSHFTPHEINSYKNKLPSLAGRYAAKLAIRKALKNQIDWKNISITTSPSGEPILTLPKDNELSENLSLSITHEGDYAAALLSVSKNKNQITVGLDATRNSRISAVSRQMPILQKILTKKELQYFLSCHSRVGGNPAHFLDPRVKPEDDKSEIFELAKVWTAKEAISKALGIGIWHGGFLQKIEILIQGNLAEVTLHDEMLIQAKAKGISRWSISFINEENLTLALALGLHLS